MKKSEWNDEQLEKLLMEMPKIKDSRNPREIYQDISLKANKKKKKAWIVPSIATAAAAILLFVLAPSFLQNNMESSTAQDSAMEENFAMEKSDAREMPAKDHYVGYENNQEDINKVDTDDLVQNNYVVRTISDDEVLLPYGVTLDEVNFTTIVSLKVNADSDNLIEQFQKNITLLNEYIGQMNSGIDEFPTEFFVDFSEEVVKDNTKTIRIDIPTDINTGSFPNGQLTSFNSALDSFDYFPGDYSQMAFFQNNEPGIMIGQSGIVEETKEIEKNKKAYFYYQNDESKFKILAFSVDSYSSFQEALDVMDDQFVQGDFILKPTIPDEKLIDEIKEQKENVEIVFKDDAKLVNNDKYILMIDAISMTAKEFGFETVTFKGNIDKIGDVPFGEPVDVPLAPNLIPLP